MHAFQFQHSYTVAYAFCDARACLHVCLSKMKDQ